MPAIGATHGAGTTDSTGSGARDVTSSTPAGTFSGQWQDGDEQIAWRADRTDGAVTQITEAVTFGADARVTRQLQFTREGTLLVFHEIRTQTMQSPDRTPGPMEVQVTLAFAGDSVSRSEKLVDGKPTTLRSFEIDYARRHAEQALAVARRSP